ncbi:MAG: hypothetical protein JWR19_3368 [Pedosphaera sp.]|nr:hypothetical protein [Pedosphaera sp.]
MIPERATSIEQRVFLRGYQKFEIRPDGDLEVTLKHFFTHNQFKVPLWHVNPNPVRLKFMQVGSLIGAIIFGLATVGTLVGMVTSSDRGLVIAMGFPLFFFGMLFLVCFWKLRTQSVNANVFYFRNGQGQLQIWFDKPDATAFQSFCELLAAKSNEAWNSRPVDPSSQSLPGELAALKKLKDSGVLNEAEFERAKAKLLEQNENRRIGFAS